MNLQPIAMLEIAVRHQLVTIFDRKVTLPFGERWLLVWGPHVCEYKAMQLKCFVSALANRAAVALALLLLALRKRHTQTSAINVEHHAVVTTRNATRLNLAVFQRGTSVYTVRVQQPNLARTISKCHQLFAHDHQESWRVGELNGHANRMPKPAHVLP